LAWEHVVSWRRFTAAGQHELLAKEKDGWNTPSEAVAADHGERYLPVK
jgi:hypothetical protein